MENRDKPATEQEVKRNPDGTYAKGTYPATGFHTNPERRHNGSWHKEDTLRYKMETIAKMDPEQLEGILHNKKATAAEQAMANCLLIAKTATDVKEASVAFNMLAEMTEQVYGKMPTVNVNVEGSEEVQEEADKIIRGFALP